MTWRSAFNSSLKHFSDIYTPSEHQGCATICRKVVCKSLWLATTWSGCTKGYFKASPLSSLQVTLTCWRYIASMRTRCGIYEHKWVVRNFTRIFIRSYLTLLLIVALLANHALGIYFYYDAGTTGDFTKLTQTFNVDHGNRTGLFIAAQFAFHKGGGGYFGLQPKQSQGGAALFSYFGKNATASHPNCKGGADGSKNGDTCLMYFHWVEGRNYTIDAELMLTNVNGTNTWEGRIWDDIEHTSRTIGRWSIPASNGFFFERYCWFSRMVHSKWS